MRFNPKARLDTSRVRDVGGSSGGGGGGGGMRIPIPGGTKAGGGIGGVLIVILFLVLTQCMNNGGTGGLPLPDLALPADTDEGYDEAEETLDELSLETEEVFDDTAGADLEVDDEL